MSKSLFCVLLILMPLKQTYPQVASHIVVAEIYGGGGDQGSYWTNDYIVLYNPTNSSINISSWSVQYAKFSDYIWEATNLAGSIPAFGYYIIQEGGGNRGVVPLPFIPNVVGNIDLDKNKGKIALVDNQTVLTVSNPVGYPGVIDFIGYGHGTNAFEGSGPAEQLGLTSSLRRKDNSGNITYGLNGNGWDTNDNAIDTYMEIDILSNPPLPVELSDFSAIVLENGVKLSWRTETEVNNFGFEIERSEINPKSAIRNLQFSKIGFVQGNGNSNSPKDYFFIDEDILSGKYAYRLKQIDTDGNYEYSRTVEVDLGSPVSFELSQNYPNPFNPSTTIKFSLPETGNVKLIVYNTIGEQVAELINETKDAGVHVVNFDASGFTSGIYIYKIIAENFVQSRKMTLLK